MNSSEVKIFQSDDGKTEIQVKLEKETVWLSQKQMADLFEKDTDTIGRDPQARATAPPCSREPSR